MLALIIKHLRIFFIRLDINFLRMSFIQKYSCCQYKNSLVFLNYITQYLNIMVISMKDLTLIIYNLGH